MVLHHKGLSMTLCTCNKEPSMICTSSSSPYSLCAHKLSNTGTNSTWSVQGFICMYTQAWNKTDVTGFVTKGDKNVVVWIWSTREEENGTENLPLSPELQQNTFQLPTLYLMKLVVLRTCLPPPGQIPFTKNTDGLTKHYIVRFISILVCGRWVHSSF